MVLFRCCNATVQSLITWVLQEDDNAEGLRRLTPRSGRAVLRTQYPQIILLEHYIGWWNTKHQILFCLTSYKPTLRRNLHLNRTGHRPGWSADRPRKIHLLTSKINDRVCYYKKSETQNKRPAASSGSSLSCASPPTRDIGCFATSLQTLI